MLRNGDDDLPMFLKEGVEIPERRPSNISKMWMSKTFVEDAWIREVTIMPSTQFGKSLEKIKDTTTGKGKVVLVLRETDDNDPYDRG